jgi:Ca2+-binding RTX toxin-like protein
MPSYNTLSGVQLRELLRGTNAVVAGKDFSFAATKYVNQTVFAPSPINQNGVENDTTGSGNQTVPSANATGNPVYIWNEIVASTSGDIPSLNLTTNGHADAIVLDTGAGINLTDLGSAGDPGDTIFGDNGKDSIAVTQGNNFVVAGSGPTTLQAGSGHDTMWGGGQSSVVGGTGDDQKLSGGLFPTAHDTLVAGTGHDDTLWAGFGSVVENGQAAAGNETLISGVAGDDTMTGNGHTFYELRNGDANVSINAGPNAGASDTISALAGAVGDENITTTSGTNFITLGSGYSTLTSGGADSVSLVNGGQSYVHATGTAADTVQFGGEGGDDIVYGQSSTATTIEISAGLTQSSTDASSIDPTTGVPPGSVASTTITFSNGSTLTYAGNVNIETSTKTF